MTNDQIDKFERQVAALAVEYGITSIGLSIMFRDPNRAYRFGAFFIANEAVGDPEISELHKELFNQGVATMSALPSAKLLVTDRHPITVVSPKKDRHDN